MSQRYTTITSGCADFNENLNKNLVKDNWINTNLNTPRCIAFDENFLYITNSEGNNIVKSTGLFTHFKPSQTEIVIWASSSASSGSIVSVPTLNKPWGIVIDGNDMYITNSGNNTITKISDFREFNLRKSSVLPNIPLKGPREIKIKDNDMYITNFDGNSITKISNFRDSQNLSGSVINFTNSNLINKPYSIVFDGDIMYISCAFGKNILKVENNIISVFLSNLTDPYGIVLKNDEFYFVSGVMVMKLNKNTKNLSRYIGSLSGSSIISNLNSPIGVFVFNEDIYITNSGNNTITKILKFEYI